MGQSGIDRPETSQSVNTALLGQVECEACELAGDYILSHLNGH